MFEMLEKTIENVGNVWKKILKCKESIGKL